MKKILISVLLFAVQLFGQSFTLNANHYVIDDTLNSEIIFDIEVTNISTSNLDLYVVRTNNNIDSEWTSSLCFTYCFSPVLDSIATTADFGSRSLSPNESRVVSLHVFPRTNTGTGEVTLRFGDLSNSSDSTSLNFTANVSLTSINDERIINNFILYQNYPNPFSAKSTNGGEASTTIRFSIPNPSVIARSEATRNLSDSKISPFNQNEDNVRLIVYNSLGQQVAELLNKPISSGIYEIQFNPNSINEKLSAGIYFYTLTSGKFSQTKKMILVK